MLAAQTYVPRGRAVERSLMMTRFRTMRPLRAWLLLAPAGAFIAILAFCSLLVLRLSFGTKDAEWTGWTLANYAALDQRLYLTSLVTTIRLALTSSVLAVVLAFPIALFMARTRHATARRLILICVLFPMLMSLLLQSWGWIVMLGPNGMLNTFLMQLGLISRPLPLLFNELSVLLGLVQTTLPLAVLPIASALQNIPRSLEEAAGVLGAPRWRVYAHVIVPLAAPGILAASLLIFGFNVGAFVVPLLLGGLRVTTVAVLIRDQMGPLLNWPLGAAASVVLIAIALGVQGAYAFVLSRGRTAGRGR
jgi:putative spermidine/putrescine transport system permease protein